VVNEHRRHLDLAASGSVSARVIILHPFVDSAQVDDHHIVTLTAVFDPEAAFDCRFTRMQ